MIIAYAVVLGLALLGLAYALFRIARDPVLGVCIFVFLSAITVTPDLPVIGDRVIVADGIMFFVIVISAFNGILFRPSPPGLRLVDQLAGIFIIIATLSSLLALFTYGDPVRVILFMLIYLYGYLCFRVILRIMTDEAALRRVFTWWTFAIVMVVGVGFLAATGIYRPAWSFDAIIHRVSATFKMSGQVSSYLGPGMFLLVYLATLRQAGLWQRAGFTVLLLLSAYVMLSTGSRISFVIMVVAMVLGSFVIVTTSPRLVRPGVLIAAMGAGIAVFIFFALSVWSDTSTRYSNVETSPLERALKMWSEQSRADEIDLSTVGGTRTDEIATALENMHRHLLLGTGSGMFSQTYKINEIHNSYVSVLAENGLLAFIALMFWWSAVGVILIIEAMRLRGTRQMIMRLVTLGFLSISIYQLTTNGLRQRPFWFAPAIALATASVLRRSDLAEAATVRNVSEILETAGPRPSLRHVS
ncbi:MAG: O-antigen ligase family protein [Pseudomonadota bacterium]